MCNGGSGTSSSDGVCTPTGASFQWAGVATGLELDSLAAGINAFVEGRRVDDNAHVMRRFKCGAPGMLWSIQVAPGNEFAQRRLG